MRRALFLCIGLASQPATATDFPVAAVLSGIARAADGDDVVFGRVHVRLRGIAAPEDRRGDRQPGGRAATANLAALVDGRYVTCHLDGSLAGSTRRPVGRCYLDGIDLGEHQVRSGVARDCPRYSGGSYAGAETAARRAGTDLSAIYPLPAYC